MVSVYVDDMLVTGSCKRLVETFKLDMSSKFEMSDLGYMTYFLGMEVNQVKDEILLNQRKFASELLVKFSMESCRPVDPSVPGLKFELLVKFSIESCRPVDTPSVPGLKFVKDDGHEKVDG